MTVNIGLQIHCKQTGSNGKGTRDYSAQEKADLDTLLPQLNADCNLVLDEYGWATRFRDMTSGLIVYRKYHQREGDFYNVTTPQDLFNDYRQYTGQRIVINIGNESSTYLPDDELRKQADFYAKCMVLFGEARAPIVVPGWGTGHPDLTRLALFKPVWGAFRQYPIHYLGIHEYFSYRGLEIGNGRVGRHADLAKWLTANNYPVPNMLVTEHGCDQIDDTGERGWKSGYDGNEDKYADDLIRARRQSYNVPYIKGVMIYSYGDSNEWSDFDISAAKQLQKQLIAENKVDFPVQTPVVIPPVADHPAPRVYQPAIAHLKNGATVVNLRSEKSTEPGTDIGDILAGDRVRYAPREGGWWPIIQILPNGKETPGFASDLYFEPVPRQSESPPPDNPVPLPIPDPPPARYKLRIHIAYSPLLSMPIEIPLPAGVSDEIAKAALVNTTIELIAA